MITDTSVLEDRDVEISKIDEVGFLITTTTKSYRTVRNLLSIMQEEQGLPVDYASEEEGAKLAFLIKRVTGNVPSEIIQEDGLSPRLHNYIVIPGYKKVGRNKDQMMKLVEDVAKRFRSMYLKVEINKNSSSGLSEEDTFVYTVVVTSVAQEIGKFSKDNPIWEGIPSIIQIMLRTGEFEALRETVAHTPPLLETVPELLDTYVNKVQNAITNIPNFKENWDIYNSREGIAKLQLAPPTNEAFEILKILQTYHNS